MKRLKVKFTNELLSDLLKVKNNVKLIDSRSNSFNNTTELLFESEQFDEVSDGCETPSTETEKVLDIPVRMFNTVTKTGLSYGEAMIALNNGDAVTREIWYGYWRIEVIKGLSNPIIVATCKDGSRVPSTPYQEDMTATDWMIVVPKERPADIKKESELNPTESFNITKSNAMVVPIQARAILKHFESGDIIKIDKYFNNIGYNPQWIVYLQSHKLIEIFPFAEGQIPTGIITEKGKTLLNKIREYKLIES